MASYFKVPHGFNVIWNPSRTPRNSPAAADTQDEADRPVPQGL